MTPAIFVLASLFIVACNSRQSNVSYETVVTESAPYRFHLNDSTSQIANYIQVIDDGDSLRLMYLNMPGRSLCFFDFSDYEEKEQIHLEPQGPDAVDLPNAGGVFYNSPDSIFIYDYWAKSFSVVNFDGKISQKISIDDFSNLAGCTPQLRATSLSPLTVVGDKIILGGHPVYGVADISNPGTVQTMTLVDTARKTLTSFAEYPGEYKSVSSDNWNPFLYLVPDFCVVDENKVIVSFPASDSIRVYDLTTLEYNTYFAGSDKSFKIKEAKSSTSSDHLYGGYAYKGIKYDRWNDVYYRVLIRPALPEIKIADYKGMNVPRPISIIVLDSDFNKIAENDFDDYHGSFIHMFVSPRGLSIHSYSDDDDYLTFRTFTPHK